MRCKLIIFFLAVSNLIFGQIARKSNSTSLIVKINVTSLIDVTSFPTVQFSVEKRLSRYFSLSAEAGYQLYTYKYTDTTFLDPQGFKVNLECRYYIPDPYKVNTQDWKGGIWDFVHSTGKTSIMHIFRFRQSLIPLIGMMTTLELKMRRLA